MPAVADQWFEKKDMGSGVIRIREQYLDPDVACNIWVVQGMKRNLIFDSGTGLVSLKTCLPHLFEQPIICVSSHTHFDHVGGSHEFDDRRLHPAEAAIIENPNHQNTTVDDYMNEGLFNAIPFEGFRPEKYVVKPAPATGFLEEGDEIDLGGRVFHVLHLPGHSPGMIGLYEMESGTLFSGDAVYDGHLYDDVYHSDIPVYIETMERLRKLPVKQVHGGHHESFGKDKLNELTQSYIQSKQLRGKL